MKHVTQIGILLTFLGFICNIYSQQEWTSVAIQCPCTLKSTDGETVIVSFGLKNFEDVLTDNLYVTVAVTGYFEEEKYAEQSMLLLGTAPLNLYLFAFEVLDTDSYEIELGQLPTGTVYFELLVHEGPTFVEESLLDFVWFDGETETPFVELDKKEMNFLIDSDHDGVDDITEKNLQTDPHDATDVPATPTIDVVMLYDSNIRSRSSRDSIQTIAHILNVTTEIYTQSKVPTQFRIVGTLDETDIPLLSFIQDIPPREFTVNILEQYGADLALLFLPEALEGACGIAEDIGGWRGRGFIHPVNSAVTALMWLNPFSCPTAVTAHEIGHLLGLGHSFVQGAVGSFYWSRGHGVQNRFGTVMSYAGLDYNGIEIYRFSDPEADCNGEPCGISHKLPNREMSANSVLSLNITKWQAATFGTPSSELDIDGDGYASDVDRFPLDANEWADSDGDGFGDNQDEFPDDPTEWSDTDNDGIGDNSDPDIDNDGVVNLADADPFDAENSSYNHVSVVSDSPDDRFGNQVLRVKDFDSDGHDDLVVSLPSYQTANGHEVGAVYVFSFMDFIEPYEETGVVRTSKPLEQLSELENSWLIKAPNRELSSPLGEHVTVLRSATNSGRADTLVLSYSNSLYVLTIRESALNSLDDLDGTTDGEIDLSHCENTRYCWNLGENSDFGLINITSLHDWDGDGTEDLVVGGNTFSTDSVDVYLLTSHALKNYQGNAENGENLFNDMVKKHEDCYRLYLDTFTRDVLLTNIGNFSGGDGFEIGVRVKTFSFFGGDSGSVYLLSTDNIAAADKADGSEDRAIKIEELVTFDTDSFSFKDGGYASSYLGRDPGNFATSFNMVSDMDSDGHSELMLWTPWDKHYIFTVTDIRALDAADQNEDGHAALANLEQASLKIWVLEDLETTSPRSQTILQSEKISHDTAIIQFNTALFAIDFAKLATLDDPIESKRDFEIETLNRLGSEGITLMEVPPGIRFREEFGGFLPIDDLDEDNKIDFLFTAFLGHPNGDRTSTIHVVFSSSLAKMDYADGKQNRELALHNNLDDTDGDGAINLSDLDDDNDGALDVYDRFPLHEQAKYDADLDGTANIIDHFPSDATDDHDLDFDGIGDKSDQDIDGDGIANWNDDFPLDTDNDGIDNFVDTDDDNDGVIDTEDPFPLDKDESIDSDGDGYGDSVDMFPNNISEWMDSDGDGIGDNADDDDDNDGYTDLEDAFPMNADEWADSDGDGYGDNTDEFNQNPFEWEDADSDGYGDNFGSLKIQSYLIDSDWSDASQFTPPEISSHPLYDYDRTGGNKVMLNDGNIPDRRNPEIILSSRALSYLDGIDDKTNHLIDPSDIAFGSFSWEFRRPVASPGTLYKNAGAIGYVDKDEVADLLIDGRFEEQGNGALHVVRGIKLRLADSFDGIQDSKVNHTQCAVPKNCYSIRGNSESGLGNSSTTLNHLFRTNQSAIVTTNALAAGLTEELSGAPLMYLFSANALQNAMTELDSGELSLNDLVTRPETLQIYSELPEGDGFSWFTEVSQIGDFDGDGAEDLLVNFDGGKTVYLIASVDLVDTVNQVDNAERKVGIQDVLEKGNSYTLIQFLTPKNHARTTQLSPKLQRNRQQLIPISPAFGANTTYLVDLTELASHDLEDGEADGFISTINVANTNSWQIDGLVQVELCNDGIAEEDTYILGLRSSFAAREIFVFQLQDLADYVDTSGITENRVHIDDLLFSSSVKIWRIQPHVDSSSIEKTEVSCIGDWNNDDETDFAVTLTVVNPAYTRVKSSTLLLMSNELPAIDKLDGTEDRNVDLKLMWRHINE